MKGSSLLVPKREGEHTDKPTDRRLDPPGLERGQHHLGIRMPAKPAARFDQFTPKLSEIENFAIKNEGESPTRRGHGLVAFGGQIYDRQPPKSQADSSLGIKPQTVIVRPAMSQRGAHSRDRVPQLVVSLWNAREETGDPAHGAFG